MLRETLRKRREDQRLCEARNRRSYHAQIREDAVLTDAPFPA